MSTGNEKKRKRGVRASRVRLHAALAQAGFKTQNALAERIADLEGLDATPKDLVNRVFGEYAVAPQSLERVARALGVPAYTLYLASNEIDRRAEDPPPAATSSPTPAIETAPWSRLRGLPPWRLASGTIAGLALLGGVLLGLPHDTSLGCTVREVLHPLHAAGHRLGIIVARFDKDPTQRGQHVLAASFMDDARLDAHTAVLQTCRVFSLDAPGDIASRRAALRARAQAMLARTGALVLLWGRVQGDRLEVRFVSTRQPEKTITTRVDGRLVHTQETRLRVAVPLAAPAHALRDVERTAVRLMTTREPTQARARRELMRAYASADDARVGPGAARDSNVRRQIAQ